MKTTRPLQERSWLLVCGVALLLSLLFNSYLVLEHLPNTQPSPFTAYLPLALPQQRHQRQLAAILL
jgi:hypothetical protein